MNTTLPSRNVLMGIVRIAFILFFATHFFSCTDEQTPAPTPSGEENLITLSLTTPKSFTPNTYAVIPDAVDELAIQTVDVLIFDASGNFFSGPHYGAVGGTTTDESDPNNIKTYTSVTLRIPEDAASNFTMAIFANSRKIINAAVTANTNTFNKTDTKAKTDVLKMILHNGLWETTTGSENLIPMHSELAVSAAIAGTGNEVSLQRMLARVNVTTTAVGLSTFDLESVHLGNYNTKGYVAAVGTLPSLPTDVGSKNSASDLIAYGIDGANSNTCTEKIYTFEAAAGTAGSVSNPCIIIGGKYNGVSENYYRIDFVDDDGDPLAIKRNHSYTFQINKIDGPGYTSPELAFASKSVNVLYEVKAWDESNIVDASFNGQYMIGTSASKFTFDAAARGITSGDNVLFVQTDYTGWTAEVSAGGASWLKLLDVASGAEIAASTELTGTYTFSKGVASPVKLKLLKNDDNQDRSASIKFTARNVSYSVNVTQKGSLDVYDVFQPEAPTYTMATDGYKIFIPVSRANSGNAIKLNASDTFTVESNDPSGTIIKKVAAVGVGNSAHVYVETGAAEGTQTVSIKNAAGTPICSWDIEVIKPEEEANSYIVLPAKRTILIPVSQISKFEAALQLLPNNDGATYIAKNADKANSWFNNIGSFKTDWLWKDQADADLTVSAAPVGAGTNGYVKVTVDGSATDGNAVVALMQNSGDGNGERIRWSWHIWVSAENPSFNTNVANTTNQIDLKFMDRNLGASASSSGNLGAFGLLYQWGRKDPFPTAISLGTSPITNETTSTTSIIYNTNIESLSTQLPTTIVTKVNVATITESAGGTYTIPSRLNSSNNVDYAVANPHIFYWRSTEIYDWYPNSATFNTDDGNGYVGQNNNLWGGFWTGVNTKTAFDPCPPGWRVPPIVTGWFNTPQIPISPEPATNIFTAATTPFGVSADYTKAGYTETDSEDNGYDRAGGGWYPAAGYRGSNSGQLYYVGAQGRYWSASPYATNNRSAGSLNFSSGNVYPVDNGNRAHGFSVRCVQE